MLEFEIIGQTLKRLDNTVPVASSQNYLYASFTLPEEIDSATAYFQININDQIFGTQVDIVDGQCIVPDSCIKPCGMYVGLTMNKSEELITTSVQYIRITESSIDSGTLPDLPDEQPNQYLEFIRMYNEIMAGVDGSGGSGIDGKSAYEVAVSRGFIGTEIQWLASLVGATGPTGPQGIQGLTGSQGIQGLKGDTGAQGIQGIQGIKGDTGATGAQGIQGTTGATGAAGTNGTNGTNGTTPVNGTDYFTAVEITQIRIDVEASINAITTVAAASNIYTIDFASKASINIAITTADAVAKTVTVANVPTSTEMYLELTYTNAAAITWFSGITWQSGSAPTLTAGKTYRMAFFTSSGGTVWHGYSAGGV